mgnify:CR=1 FL=1
MKKKPGKIISKILIYVALFALAVSIIVPVAWVFMASLKKNAEFIGGDVNPWALPKTFHYQNFITAFQDANFLFEFCNCNSNCIVTAVGACTSGILCTCKI